MRSNDSGRYTDPPEVGPVERPSTCPACQSPSITTTSNSPDANSYWRCGRCGEVWNVARRHARPTGVKRWR